MTDLVEHRLQRPRPVPVDRPSRPVFATDAQAAERTEETLLPEGIRPRARGGTERGWTIEKTIVGPPPPAETPRAATVAPARPPVVEPPRLTGLLPIRPMPAKVDASAKGIVPPPIVPAPPSYRSPRSTTSSKAMAAAARKPAALIVDDSGGVTAPTEPPRLEPHAAVPGAAPGRDGFPRSAAERAGASASAALRPSPARRPSASHLAAVPSRAGSPQLAPSTAEIEPVALAQGSVTTPLPAAAAPVSALSPVLLPPALDPTPLPVPLELTPAPSARRRPPTVEFPTLDSSDLSAGHAGATSDETFRDLPAASPRPDPVPARAPLPSIYSVIDRRAQPAAAPPASSSWSGAFGRLSTLDAQAVPEPIPPEVAPVHPEPLDPPPHRERAAPARAQPAPRLVPAASLAPAVAQVPVEHPAAARRGRSARSRSAPRPVASFSAAEAAFFDQGEQLAAAEWEAALDDDRSDQYRIKRRGLWRRLTGRR